MTVTMPDVWRFEAIFRGRRDIRGALHGECVKQSVTIKDYVKHLTGKESLGVYPLLQDGTCHWCAADVDVEDLKKAVQLVEALAALGVGRGVWIERSKSKGYHVFIFFDAPVPAVTARTVMKTALRAAGLPVTTEIFPKQSALSDETRFGNYLNLPYHAAGKTDRRVMLDLRTLYPLSVHDFLERLEPFPASALPLVLESLPAPLADETRDDRNPRGWLPAMLATPIAKGGRRPSLTRFAGALRVRDIEEDAAVYLGHFWNAVQFRPPLSDEEVEKHVRGIYQRYGTGSPIDDVVVNGDRSEAELLAEILA
jgi:hypothetical protein